MSARASPAVLPDPKRPRLLAPGDEASSTPAAPSGAPSGLARGNYTGRVPAHVPGPAPSRAPARYERASYPASQRNPASQRGQGNLAQSSSPTTSTGRRPSVPPPTSSTTSSSVLPASPRKSGLPFTEADNSGIVLYLRTGLQGIVIAAFMERTPQEIQSQISLLTRRHEHGKTRSPQMRPPYTAEDYERLLKMHRVGASAERIAFVLDRNTASVMSHYKKHKPVWDAAGGRVEALTLLRDNEIDYKERIRAELAGAAAALAASLARAPLVTHGGPPTATADPPHAGITKPSEMPRPLLVQPTVAKPPLASNASDPNVPAFLPSMSDHSTQSVPGKPRSSPCRPSRSLTSLA